MRKLVSVGMLLLSCTAVAGERVLLMDQLPRFAGDVVKMQDMTYALYPDRPCDLPLVHAKDMKGGFVRYGDGPHKLCWGTTLRNDVLIVDDLGETAPPVPISGYRVAEISTPGSATIIKSMENKKDYEPCPKSYGPDRWCRKGQY